MDELKPCPFCGHPAALRNFVIEAEVKCNACDARVTRSHSPNEDTGIRNAIAAWKRRPADVEADRNG